MKYYIIAGEASGDLHGSNLMRAILHKDPKADIRFWGGDAMEAVGGTMVRHISDLAYMGIVEVALHARTVLGNISLCKKDIMEFHPDVIVYIDYPGFNLKIAKFAHEHGFKNVHYISPQLWAWKKGRLKTMRRDLDELCYILPFEQDFYAKNHFPKATYVGHPLLDAIENYQAGAAIDCPEGKKLIALLPGSRRMELNTTMPSMIKLAKSHPQYHFVIAGMRLLGDKYYQPWLADTTNVSVVYDRTYDLLSCAYAAVVCSGTATLETALFNVPQVVCYRANAISAAIARVLIGNNIKYISLVNLIVDKPVVKELVQEDFTYSNVEQFFLSIATDENYRSEIFKGYAEMRKILGNAGASDTTADEIINIMEQ